MNSSLLASALRKRPQLRFRIVRRPQLQMAFSTSEVKNQQYGHLQLSTSGPIDCALAGSSLLRSPYFNKGSAFTEEERKEFDLNGLLPSRVQTLQDQVNRAYRQYSTRQQPIAKNTFMASMKEQNEVLYYALLQQHIKEMLPIVYTPTQGDAIQEYSHIFRRPAGCFLSVFDQDNVDAAMSKWGSKDDIDLVLVTDSEGILGIGDQGVGGILIAIAKLALYTLCAGIHPHRVLPVVLDCGTDNDYLLSDELYLGLKRPRVRGKEYDQFVSKFVAAAQKYYPKAMLHFEDFGLKNASRILQRWQPEYPVFNDDIQGTGCTALSALRAAVHVTKTPIKDLRIICFGAGSAGIGIVEQIAKAIAIESGTTMDEARSHFWCVDRPGLLLKSHGENLTPGQEPYAREDSEWASVPHDDLLSVVKAVKPHVLIGCSTKSKAFSEDVIKEMASHVDQPIILPLSNPTRLCEADPKDVNEWTEGRALMATGSPFPPVEWNGVKRDIAECNNVVVYPGIGLGSILSRAKIISDEMLVAASEALAKEAPALQHENGALLPDVIHVRRVSTAIAKAVIKQAVAQGLNQEKDIPTDDKDLDEWITEQMWKPVYRQLKRINPAVADKHARGAAGVGGDKDQ